MNDEVRHVNHPSGSVALTSRGNPTSTYQMRNPMRRLADACATELDVHCYFQHAACADLVPRGAAVLDVCCGRGLLIPFLHYRKRGPSVYVGVDIEPKNATWARGRDPRLESRSAPDWSFDCVFVQAEAARMVSQVRSAHDAGFGFVAYQSAIEHMHPAEQRASLAQAAALAAPGALLYLTFPVTSEGGGGDGPRYAVHCYEPKLSEVRQWLSAAGWREREVVGLCTVAGSFRAGLRGAELELAERLYRVLPREQALPAIAALFPSCATEVAVVAWRDAATPQGVAEEVP